MKALSTLTLAAAVFGSTACGGAASMSGSAHTTTAAKVEQKAAATATAEEAAPVAAAPAVEAAPAAPQIIERKLGADGKIDCKSQPEIVQQRERIAHLANTTPELVNNNVCTFRGSQSLQTGIIELEKLGYTFSAVSRDYDARTVTTVFATGACTPSLMNPRGMMICRDSTLQNSTVDMGPPNPLDSSCRDVTVCPPAAAPKP